MRRRPRSAPYAWPTVSLRGRFQIILEYADRKHTKEDVETLRTINKDLVDVIHDRNVIVHGVVHARVEHVSPVGHGQILAAGDIKSVMQVPCWTITKGKSANKSFPISTKAVEIVRTNVQTLAHRLLEFNKRFAYRNAAKSEAVEQGWPKPLQ